MKRSTKIMTGILVGVNALLGAGFALQSLPVDRTDASGFSHVPHGWWYTMHSPSTWNTTANTTVDSQINAQALNTTDIWQQQQSRYGWDTRQNAFVFPTATVDVNSIINAHSLNNGSSSNGYAYPYDPNKRYGYGSANYCLYHSCGPIWNTNASNGSTTSNVDSTINASAVNNTEIWQQQQSGGPQWGTSPMQSAQVNPTATVNVDSSITANSNNGSSGWGMGGNGTANTDVHSTIDASAVNNTTVWQQQQSTSPDVSQTAEVNPTATVNVDSTINANSGWSH